MQVKRNLDDRQFTAWIREVDLRIASDSKKEKTRRRDLGGFGGGDRHAWRSSGNGNGSSTENGNGQSTAVRERKCFAIEDIDTLVVT